MTAPTTLEQTSLELERAFVEAAVEMQTKSMLPLHTHKLLRFKKYPPNSTRGHLYTAALRICALQRPGASALSPDDEKQNNSAGLALADRWCQQLLQVVRQKAPGVVKHVDFSTSDGYINVTLKDGHSTAGVRQDPSSSGSLRRFHFRSVGFIECVPNSSSKGVLTLAQDIPTDSLNGFDGWSHLWVIYLRTPRTPRIGMAVLQVEQVSERCIHVSGWEGKEKTMILDIKPYHPCDQMSVRDNKSSMSILFTPEADQQLSDLVDSLQFFTSVPDVKKAVVECIAQDPRSQHSLAKEHKVMGIALDRLQFSYLVLNDTSAAKVFHVGKQSDNPYPLRSAKWVEWVQQFLPNESEAT